MALSGKARAGTALLAAVTTAAGIVVASTVTAPRASAANTTVCDKYCDARNPSLAAGDRHGPSGGLDGRQLVLHFDDADNMAWATLSGGAPGDQVWLDRSWDGGFTWANGSRLGLTAIPAGDTGWHTEMFNLDDWSSTDPLEGVVRACAEIGTAITCTPWARTTWNAADNQRAAATAMMQFYNVSTGLFPGWWNSANDLTAIIDNIRVTGMNSYKSDINRTYNDQKTHGSGDYRNGFTDDTGWWAMAWIDAYDLTGVTAYLTTAEDDSNWMAAQWDGSTCGGGIYWEIGQPYKAAISNELYLYVNAALYNRTKNTTYLTRAEAEWNWFSSSGLINASHLVTDGISAPGCGVSTTVWTYNQGVILEGLTELYLATGNSSVIATAETLANASTSSPLLNPASATAPKGELADPSGNPTFTGAYIRGLTQLNKEVGLYGCYLDRQSAVAYLNDRNDADQYGTHWAGPWHNTPQSTTAQPGGSQQGSAVFLQNAGLTYTSPTSPTISTALNC